MILKLLRAGWLCLFLFSGVLAAFPAETPNAKLTYQRVFKGSIPEYLRITVDPSGQAEFEGRSLSDVPIVRPFVISQSTVGRLFSLAEQLNYFQSVNLESRKKVANMGEKSFAYARGSEVNRTVYNYTENRTAQDLAGLFEKVALAAWHVVSLEFQMKYDPLGLARELQQVQIDFEAQRLAEPEVMIPALDKIAQNSRYMHLAQTRAQEILQRIRSNQ
jgi:hypothetical protein